MKRYVVTFCFLDGSEPFIMESDLSEIQIKHKIDTHIKTKTWESDLCVDLGIQSKIVVPELERIVCQMELKVFAVVPLNQSLNQHTNLIPMFWF
jgi:hypothetical protein